MFRYHPTSIASVKRVKHNEEEKWLLRDHLRKAYPLHGDSSELYDLDTDLIE
jgi:hypothetical protein